MLWNLEVQFWVPILNTITVRRNVTLKWLQNLTIIKKKYMNI